LLGAEGLDLGSALLGALGGAGFGDAIGSELVADEGRDGLSVVLETRSRAVGRACALPLQGVLNWRVSFCLQSERLVKHTSSQLFLLVLSLQRVSQVFCWAPHQPAAANQYTLKVINWSILTTYIEWRDRQCWDRQGSSQESCYSS
jgi:hypothetical protein